MCEVEGCKETTLDIMRRLALGYLRQIQLAVMPRGVR